MIMSVRTDTIQPDNPGTRLFAGPIRILRERKRAYVGLNVFYYGVIVLGMIYAAFDPALQQTVLQSIGTAFSQGP